MNLIRTVFLALALCTPAVGAPQFLFDSGSIRDLQSDGTGDSINLNPELLSFDGNGDNHAVREFYAGDFVSNPISTATIAGTITALDQIFFDIDTGYASGVVLQGQVQIDAAYAAAYIRYVLTA